MQLSEGNDRGLLQDIIGLLPTSQNGNRHPPELPVRTGESHAKALAIEARFDEANRR